MTSRNPDCKSYSTVGSEELRGLPIGRAVELLLKAAKIQAATPAQESAAMKINGTLGSHTLALIQAGAYVSKGFCKLEDYPDVFHRKKSRLLQFAPSQMKPRHGNVYATFEITLQVLKSSPKTLENDALELLGILSAVHHGDFPIYVFQNAWESSQNAKDSFLGDSSFPLTMTREHVSWLHNFMKNLQDQWDDFRLKNAIALLVSLALVNVSDCYLSMHALTHDWFKERQSLNEQALSWSSSGSVLAFLVYEGHQDFDLGKAFKQLRQHDLLQLHLRRYLQAGCEGLYRALKDRRIATQTTFAKCIYYLTQIHDNMKAMEIMEWFFKELGIHPDNPTPTFWILYNLRAETLGCIGNIDQAIQLSERLVRMKKPEWAKHSVKSHYTLGLNYLHASQFPKALRLYKEIDKIQASTLASNHPDRLHTQQMIAIALQGTGQLNEAQKLLENIDNVQAGSSLALHPSRLLTEFSLALSHIVNDRPKEAIGLLEPIVAGYIMRGTEPTPNQLIFHITLASAYSRNSQAQEAINLLEPMVNSPNARLRENNFYGAPPHMVLAFAYLDKRQFRKGRRVLESYAEMLSSTLPEDHPYRKSAKEQLAVYNALAEVRGERQ